MTGWVNSIQSLAAVDGPGVRFAVFMQGCGLRCGYCHNPDTWSISGGTEYAADDVVAKCERYREYFGSDGGITLSGGEPLLQAKFVCDVFKLCRERGINTCLDTSGSVFNDDVKNALCYTDRVLLDIKFTRDELYQTHIGCGIDDPMSFLRYLDSQNILTTLRQVIIPGLNCDEKSVKSLRDIANIYKCVDKVELLPFRKMCRVKYKKMQIPFPFDIYDEPTADEMTFLNNILHKK